MDTQGMFFLAMVIAAFILFGGALGFASWSETRARKSGK